LLSSLAACLSDAMPFDFVIISYFAMYSKRAGIAPENIFY